jgi:putative membrane protein
MEAAWHSVLVGLPVLLVHLAVTIGLLIGGVSLYVYLAPYRELGLIREGNVAAAVVLAGQTLAIAIPLAAMMANSVSIPDIVLWGIITIILQYVAIVSARFLVRRLGEHIARGDVAAALVLAVGQIAAGLLNAAALMG